MMNNPAMLICGVDEAGRGPLAGPVFAAAVILGARITRSGLADSKTLSPTARERLSARIRDESLAWSVASASVFEIDELNILQATLLAMRRAVEALSVRPAQVLIDGTMCPRLDVPARAVVRGDATIAEISAASILAKTARDQALVALDALYPQYGFARHKGYGTPGHLAALRQHGPSPEHRSSFAPVRAAARTLF